MQNVKHSSDNHIVYDSYTDHCQIIHLFLQTVFVKNLNCICQNSKCQANYYLYILGCIIYIYWVDTNRSVWFVIVNWRCWKVLICNQNYPSDGQEEWIKSLEVRNLTSSEIGGTETSEI